MALPKFLQPYLASYNLSALDKNDPSVKREVVSQVLNLGDEKAIKWLFKNYSEEETGGVVKNPIRGVWLDTSLKYWEKILGVWVETNKHKSAVINLNPY